MSMAQKWAAYFSEEAQEEDRAQDTQSLKAGQAFLTHCAEYEAQLQDLIARNEPRPDTHEGMLYQIGVRDGLNEAQKLIDGIRARVLEAAHDR